MPDGAAWTTDPALEEYRSWLWQWESCLPTNRACAEFVLSGFDASGAITTGEDNLNVAATMLGAYLAFQKDIRVAIPSTLERLHELAKCLDRAKIGYPDFPIDSTAGK